MKTYTTASSAARAARKEIGPDAIKGVDFSVEKKGSAFIWLPVIDPSPAEASVLLATEHEDMGMVPQQDALQQARQIAQETGCTVYLRDPLTDDILNQVKPPKAPKAAPKAEAAKVETPHAQEEAPQAPTGKTAEVIQLALRPQGVTPAELNEATQWKGAPWKWLFSNPKGTGFADRWGYKLQVEREGRKVRYKLQPIAA